MNKTTGGIPPWRPLGKLETLRLWEQTTERVSSEQPYTDSAQWFFYQLCHCWTVGLWLLNITGSVSQDPSSDGPESVEEGADLDPGC